MNSKFMQISSALAIPISFIIVIYFLNVIPIPTMSKYGLGGILLALIALFITYIALKKDKKQFSDMGLNFESKTPIRFTIGFLIGATITVLIIFIILNLSDLVLIDNPNNKTLNMLLWLLGFLPLAFMEEVIFRGYGFLKIKKNLGIWPAQILMALFFAWYHDFTGMSFFNQLLGPGVWALIYGIAAIWSKGLAFPTGLHMAINVVLALVGQKDEKQAIWNLEYLNEPNTSAISQTESTGMLIQLCILVIAIILTEYYRKYKNKV